MSCYISAISGASSSHFLSLKIVVFNGEHESESIIYVQIGKNPSFGITICHHLTSLVMPNGDPREAFF